MGYLARLALGVFRSPILWGLLAAFGCYSLARASGADHPLLARYVAGHGALQAVVAAFFVAATALVLKALELLGQASLLDNPVLGEPTEGGQPISDVRLLLARIAELPRAWKDSYLLGRFHAALSFVDRKQSIDGLDEELRRLADRDTARMHASYGLVRTLLWALPLLGALGAVMQLPAAMNTGTEGASAAGFSLAFDALALSLGLVVAVLVAQHLLMQAEAGLLHGVDEHAARELVGRFQDSGSGANPLAGAVRRMAETMVRASERLVVQQTELWKATVDAAHQQWTTVANSSGKQLETTLAAALDRSLSAHASRLAAQERAAGEMQRTHWEQVQHALIRAADTMNGAQLEIARQNESLVKLAGATAQLEQLESALNRNLNTLAGATHFEETVMSLSAAIHLITGRMSQDADGRPAETATRRPSQAA